jgi:hypothetical protein
MLLLSTATSRFDAKRQPLRLGSVPASYGNS